MNQRRKRGQETLVLFLLRISQLSLPTTESSHECYRSHALRIFGSLDTQVGRLYETLFASYSLVGRRSEVSLGEWLM